MCVCVCVCVCVCGDGSDGNSSGVMPVDEWWLEHWICCISDVVWCDVDVMIYLFEQTINIDFERCDTCSVEPS